MTKSSLNKSLDDKLPESRTAIDWNAVRTALVQANSNTQAVLSPPPERIAEVFAERAKELAREKATVTTRQWREFTLFELNVQQFAVETRYLRGVALAGAITPLPGVPQYLLGVTSHKGDIVAVIDSALLMNQQPFARAKGDYLLLLGEQGVEFALLVSAVTGQRKVALEEIKPLGHGADGSQDAKATAALADSLVLGLLTHPGSTRAATVLDGAALLADERLYFTV